MNRALLIIDIQNDYFEGGANPLVGSKEASENASKILSKFRKENLPVIHIQHISGDAGPTFFLPNTFGAEIHTDVAPVEGEKIITKHYPNSFRETELLEYLQGKGIQELVVCGMMTQMCVDTSVRAAKDLGFECLVIEDACATLDLQINEQTVKAKDVQNAFMASLSYFFATISSTQEYLKR